jgi:23S rRNA pseudouridine2605 synthase
VGRLDAESKGLLLLTNDGELTNRLTHPRYGVAKTYRAVVDGSVQAETLVQLEKGVWLADEQGKGFKASAGQVKISHRERDKTILDITVREGRNLQVRRLLAKFGHKVRDLTRIRIGPLTLEGLPAGKFRELTTREIRQLQQVAEGKKKDAEHDKKRAPSEPRKAAPPQSRARQRGPRKGR